MGQKKIVSKNYCEDDSGYRIPCQRKNKDSRRHAARRNPHASITTGPNGNFAINKICPFKPTDFEDHNGSRRPMDSLPRALHELSISDDDKKNEKRLEQSRRNQRMIKYDSIGSNESSGSDENLTLWSHRKPSPPSPLSLWKKNNTLSLDVSGSHRSPRKPDTARRVMPLSKSKSSASSTPSPFRATLEDGILSPQKCLSNPGSPRPHAVGRTLTYGEALSQEEYSTKLITPDWSSQLVEWAHMLYSIIFKDSLSQTRRWDEADDSEGEDSNDHPAIAAAVIDKVWFTKEFSRILDKSQTAANYVEKMAKYSDDNDAFSVESIIVDHFLVNSSFLLDSLVKGLVFEDDRVTSLRAALLYVLYQCLFLSNVESVVAIRRSIVCSLYDSCYARYRRCVAGESVCKSYEIDMNHLAVQGLMDEIVYEPEEAVALSIRACSTQRGPNKVKATEENSGFAVHDHLTSTMQVVRSILTCEAQEREQQASERSCHEGRLEYLSKTVICMYRCFVSPLGSTSGTVENPTLQSNLLGCFILLVQVICRSECAVSLMNDILKAIDTAWPLGSFVMEQAFIDAAAVALSAHNFCSLTHLRSHRTVQALGEVLALPMLISSTERVLNRLLKSCESSHFKVSQRAMAVFQSPTIMMAFFIVSDEDDEAVTSAKERLMEKLVVYLRSNRSHWHPLVRLAADSTFEYVFNYFT